MIRECGRAGVSVEGQECALVGGGRVRKTRRASLMLARHKREDVRKREYKGSQSL